MRQTRTRVDARCVASPSRRSCAGESAPIAWRVGAGSPHARTIARSIASARRASISWPQTARSTRVCDGRAAERAKAVQVPDRRAEQRVVAEAARELGRVGVQREHEPQQPERLLVGRAQDDEPVGALPRLPAAAARKRRLERGAPVGHQVQAVRPARSDDVLDHRPAPYSCPRMRLADRISLRSRRRKFGLFMETMAPTESTTVLDIGVDDVAFGEDAGCRTLNFFEELYPWPQRVTALGVARRGALPRELSAGALRPGRRARASLRGRRVRHRVLECRDRARRRPRGAAPLRRRGAARLSRARS